MEKKEKIVLIAAVANNGVIGYKGDIPWKPYKGDLKRFKELTLEHSVIMGRKTADEIESKKYFPLSDRRNIIISLTKNYNDYGAEVFTAITFRNSIELASGRNKDELIYVIGGQSLFDRAINIASRLEITEIPLSPEGDTYFPKIGSEWTEIFREEKPEGHSFVTYEKK